MVDFKTVQAFDFQGKTVVLRADLNVPMKDGVITDNERILASLDTIKYLLGHNCKIVLLSHLSRVKSLDDKKGKKSLQPVASALQNLLKDTKVHFCPENTGDKVKVAVNQLPLGEILVLENTRYCDVNEAGEVVKHESKNNAELAQFWASLGDIFVNDAFGTAHRRHASNAGIAKYIKNSCIGLLMERELINLYRLINNPPKPFVVVLGGAKVSDKLQVVNNLLKIADHILIGGGMVNTFLKALGNEVGTSLVEEDLVQTAKQILDSDKDKKIVLGVDQMLHASFKDEPGVECVVAPQWSAELQGFMSLDVGSKTVALFSSYLAKAKTIFWNGPMGVFEFSNYAQGTLAIGKAIAQNQQAFSVIGGGDSAAAAKQLQIADQFSFISTGGGASLALIGGEELVGISDIQKK